MLTRTRLALAFSTFALLLPASAAAQPAPPRLLPTDQAAEDPSFFSFRARLLEAAARRDTTFLFAHTAPDVRVTFGVENGLDALVAQWTLSSAPDRSDFWPTLARVAGRGGRFYGGTLFMAPYVHTEWPEDLDAFDHIAVTGEDVRVRAAPSTESAVLTKLSFTVVPVEQEEGTGWWNHPWTKVRLPDGQAGYVASVYLYSPVGYRASFEKQNGRWVMTSFIAGD